MEPLQYSTLVHDSTVGAEAFSALPGAPVVPYTERAPRVAAPRARLAGALRRLADTVAPSPAPGRRHAYADGGPR